MGLRSVCQGAFAGGVAVLALAVSVASAQTGVPVPESITWERLAVQDDPWDDEDSNGLGFCGNVLVSTSGIPFILRDGGPGYPANAGTWERILGLTARDIGCSSVAGREILYFDRSPANLYQSLDFGLTATEVLQSGELIPFETPGGALVGRFDHPDYLFCRTDDGDAWTCGPYRYLNGAVLFPRVLAAPPPGGFIPATRLLANGQGGPAYSDDDGRTWHPSDLMVTDGRFGYGLAVVDGGPLHGTAVAVAQGYAPTTGVWEMRVFQSTDGATWTDVARAPAISPYDQQHDTYLTALPGGLVAAYNQLRHKVWLSGDAGRTWHVRFESAQGGLGCDQVGDVEVGPDGKVYLAVSSCTQPTRGGVFRSVEAFVAGDTAPPSPGGLSLAVRPNPASGAREVVVRLAAPADLRVVVTDASGRVVFERAEASPGGARVVRLEASGWAAGVYVVRAEAGGASATARLVVTR